jgi:hypothetical protein
MQPSGKGRFAAKGRYLAEKLEKSFLGQIFRIGGVPHHAKA